MPSKLCPNCFKVINCNIVPNYCAWGCGSIQNEPLIPKFNTYEETLQYIEKRKEEIIAARNKQFSSYEVEPGKFQMRLFQC